MKQSPMPRRKKPMAQRKTLLEQGSPLRRRTELGRGTAALGRSTPLARRTELCSTARQAAQRQRDTGPSRSVRDLLKTLRAKDGMCERCGVRRGVDVHHRRGRKAGGTKRPEINFLSNLLLLCRSDHELITNTNGHRAEYEHEGLLIREDGRNPAAVKVLLAGGWFLLDNEGLKTPTTAPEMNP